MSDRHIAGRLTLRLEKVFKIRLKQTFCTSIRPQSREINIKEKESLKAKVQTEKQIGPRQGQRRETLS